MEVRVVPTFPPAVMIGVFLLTLPLLVWSLRRLPGRSAAFLLCATWLRLLLAALHPYTYPPIAAGLSLNALGSIVAVMVGVLLLDLRLWHLEPLTMALPWCPTPSTRTHQLAHVVLGELSSSASQLRHYLRGYM